MKKVVFLLTGFLCSVVFAKAQFTTRQKADTIDSIAKVLTENYVFPETAKQTIDYLRLQLQKKVYDTISSGEVFAQVMTAELQRAGKDRHLSMNYSAQPLPPQTTGPLELPAEEEKAYAQWLLSENYGITSVKVLPGNIGYIDFKWFCDPQYAGDTYAALMNYISHTDALIIDLRNSQGSMSPDAIPFICSYFFKNATHLNDLYWKEGNRIVQSWTHKVVPGKKYLDKPIYILTSGKTFSGAEELSYDLKNLKRAVLVGETTGGGANPGGSIRENAHFTMFVPVGRAVNPITKTNWEGVGVAPDTIIKSNRALFKAQKMALQYLLQKKGADSQWVYFLRDQLALVEKAEPVYKKYRFELEGFEQAKEIFIAGSFNNWSPKSDQLQRVGNKWVIDLEAEPGKHTYKFVVDNSWILDPGNPQKEKDREYENSMKIIQ
ncbi:MAG: hypothetical protein KGZ74_19645 [Chitinophagaceae bacterium]|nr:hypothetical protein [Chitinophagaceae bacterium]